MRYTEDEYYTYGLFSNSSKHNEDKLVTRRMFIDQGLKLGSEMPSSPQKKEACSVLYEESLKLMNDEIKNRLDRIVW